MPPKKEKKEKKPRGSKKDETPPPEPEKPLSFPDDGITDRDLDMLTDLNEEFFGAAIKIQQNLMEHGRIYEASRIKRYVDIIFILHRKYVEEVKEVEVLRPQVITAANKLRVALELTVDTEDMVSKFRVALSQAWRETDASLAREQGTQDKMRDLLMKCQSFESKEIKQQDDSSEFGHLSKYKNIILRERDRLNAEVNDLEKRLQLQRYYTEGIEYILKNNEDILQKLSMKLRIFEAEKQNFEVKIRQLINKIDEQKESNIKTVYALESTSNQLEDTARILSVRVGEIEHLKFLMEKLRSEASFANKQLARNDEEVIEMRKIQKENDETIRTMRIEDKAKAATIYQLTNKLKKALKDYDDISMKLYKLNRVNHTQTEDIARYKNTIDAKDKDIHLWGQKWEDMRRMKENVARDRDQLRSDIIKLNNNIADLKHTMALQNNNIDSLRMDINKMNVKLDEAKINIWKAEKDRDEMAQEEQTLNERIEFFQDQVQLKSEHVLDLTDKLTVKNNQLFNVKKQLESVHSQKMILQRTLETCSQERDDFRVLQTKTSHQICQLTSEITDNQNAIIALNLRIERMTSEKKEMQTEIKLRDAQITGLRKEMKVMRTKSEILLKTIAEDEYKFMKQHHELEETRKEKNLIGLQMVRRNDEIVLLKDKFNIMQTALDKGQTQYNLRIEDIRLLKTEVKNLQTERSCHKRAIEGTADMRMEIVRLQRALNQERIQCRGLIEDAKTPTSVHRWRFLKGEDPARYALVEKVQILQRRNMQCEIDKTNLKEALAEKQRLCDNLKKVIEEMPSKEIKKRLVEAQRRNREQTKKLKALNAELAIDEIELRARDCIIEEFKASLSRAQSEVNAAQDESTFKGKVNNEHGKYSDCAVSTSEPSENEAHKCKPKTP